MTGIPFHLEGKTIEQQVLEKKLFNVIEVSKMLGIGKAKVYELIKSGKLSALNLGGLKVRKEAIDKFLDKYEGYDITNKANNVSLNS